MKYSFRFALIFILGLALDGMSYTRIVSFSGEPATWEQKQIPFWICRNGSPQVANGSEFAAVQAAFQTWQHVPTAEISLQYMGTTSVHTIGQDGLNLVTFTDDTILLGSEVVAATFLYFRKDSVGTVIEEADIALNPSMQWSTSAEADHWDIQGVLTHGVGHFLGLGHSGLLSSVMMPYGAPQQLWQRVLTYDDMAGATECYPKASAITSLGSISGVVYAESSPVFGAHVVAVDAEGTPLLSTLSRPDGSYQLDFLPAGSYRVYAEPLDDPVSEQNVGGSSKSFYFQLNTAFGTTYFGDVAELGRALTSPVFPGQKSESRDIQVQPAATLNLTEPGSSPMRLIPGQQTFLTVGGVDFPAEASFSASHAGIGILNPTFGGSISPYAPISAILPTTVSPNTALGPKNLTVTAGGASSVLSGGLVITLPSPSSIQITPANGPMAGGTAVTITGQNFRSGVQVYFSGLPATGVQLLNSGTIQANTPANILGSTNLLVVNEDGTWGNQSNAFSYLGQPPQISSLSVTSGPPTTIIAILGDGFDTRVQNLQVLFGNTAAKIITASTGRIEVIVPYGAGSGPITVTVAGQTATGPIFTVTPVEPSSNRAPDIPQFIDATKGTPVPLNSINDAAGLVELPFTFSLFQDIYPAGSKIAVCTNGWISLDAVTNPENQNGPLPGGQVQQTNGSNASIPSALIAPFFADLYVRTGLFVDFGRKVVTKTVGTAPNRQFVIEWSDMGILDENKKDSGSRLTFEVILYEGSHDIQFIYPTLTGLLADGSTATVGIQNSAASKAIQTSYNQASLPGVFSLTYHFDLGNYTTIASITSKPFSIPNLGGLSFIAEGSSNSTASGYGILSPDSEKTTAAGTAIIGFTMDDILISELPIPSSSLRTTGRIYFEFSDRIRTGLALANPNNQAVTVYYYFTDKEGTSFGWGGVQIPANGQVAGFLDQAPFNANGLTLGTMTFTSEVSISAVALRGLTNERGEFLMAALPIAPTTENSADSTIVLPQFADGAGWKTELLLVNPGDEVISGTIQFLASDGQLLTLTANGESLSTFPFTLAAKGSFQLTTAGNANTQKSGWMVIYPDSESGLPAASAVLSFRANGVTTTITGLSPLTGTTFRSYVEMKGTAGTVGAIRSGVALVNSTPDPIEVYFELTDLDGNSLGWDTSHTISGAQHRLMFLEDIFTSRPASLQGILRVSASEGLSIATLRERINQRGEYLLTTMTTSDETAAPVGEPRFFPHLIHGGGYSVQFILISGCLEEAPAGTLKFVSQSGSPLPLLVR